MISSSSTEFTVSDGRRFAFPVGTAFLLLAGVLFWREKTTAMWVMVGIAGVLLQWPFADPVVISPSVVPGLMAMSAVVLLIIVMMRTQMRVTRVEGMVLILIGVARWVADFAFQGQF